MLVKTASASRARLCAFSPNYGETSRVCPRDDTHSFANFLKRAYSNKLSTDAEFCRNGRRFRVDCRSALSESAEEIRYKFSAVARFRNIIVRNRNVRAEIYRNA